MSPAAPAPAPALAAGADRVGSPRQLMSVTSARHADGPENGSRLLVVRAGGISVDVLPDRGLDLGHASVRGLTVSWLSPAGFPALGPEPAGRLAWQRGFGGGLLTTCGMTHVGPADDENGLHGRVSALAAADVAYGIVQRAGEESAWVTGVVTESELGGPTLQRHRRITVSGTEPVITVEDVVTNISAVPAVHEYRFHPNLGFPAVQPGDRVAAPGRALTGWRADAPPASDWETIAEPRTGAGEEVLYLGAHRPGSGVAALHRAGDADPYLELRWEADALPELVLWKFAAPRMNVIALEPSTIDDSGCRTAGSPPAPLKPDESRHYRLTFRFDPARLWQPLDGAND